MKKIIFISLVLFVWLSASAQDKIITMSGDTILCRIVSMSQNYIVYEQNNNGKSVSGKTISIGNVAQYFRSSAVQTPEKDSWWLPEHPLLFSLQGGLAHSYLDLSNSSSIYGDDYISKYKNGFYLNACFHYLPLTFLGVGFDYSFFRSATKGDFLVNANYGYGGLPVYVTVSSDDRMYLNFIAPSIMFMEYLGTKKIRFSQTLAPGVSFMRMESRGTNYSVFNSSYSGNPPMYYEKFGSVTTGSNIAVKISLALDYCITSNWSAGLAGNFTWLNIKKFHAKYTGGEDSGTADNAVNFSHLD